jgi:hypothetical protein
MGLNQHSSTDPSDQRSCSKEVQIADKPNPIATTNGLHFPSPVEAPFSINDYLNVTRSENDKAKTHYMEPAFDECRTMRDVTTSDNVATRW